MPDTGAPWNIPYVAGTDLVADWPTDSQTLATAIADGLDAAGKIAQVVQTVKTDTFTGSSATYASVTGLSVTLTPGSATNKVLLIAQVNASLQATNNNQTYALRITGGNAADYDGDAAGSKTLGAVSPATNNSGSSLGYYTHPLVIAYLDSPATTSSTTYQVEYISPQSLTVCINRAGFETDNAYYVRSASSITAIEVKA